MLGRLKSAVKEVLRRRLQVPSIDLAMERLAKQGFAPSLIFDVGAYQGDYATLCRGLWPKATIACFEPQKRARERLQSIVDSNMRTYDCLLGAEERENIPFHEAETASSVLSEVVNKSHPVVYHRMRTIDSILSADFKNQPIDLLKMDVQGYELEVLRGATNALSNIKVILAEVNLLDLHEGVPLMDELTTFLNQHGFVAFDVCGMTRRPLDGALWQIDMLFVPRQSPLRQDKRWGATDPTQNSSHT